jgi:hypothetical protein
MARSGEIALAVPDELPLLIEYVVQSPEFAVSRPIAPIPNQHANQAPTLDVSGVLAAASPSPDPTNPWMARNPAHATRAPGKAKTDPETWPDTAAHR